MLEVPPIPPVYFIKILGKITKDTRLLEPYLRKKKTCLRHI
jgi:hypothetical protein